MINSFTDLLAPGRNRPSLSIVRRSVLITLSLLALYVALSLLYLSSLQSDMNRVSEVHNRKVEIIHRMSNIVQARSLYLYTVALNGDPWFRDRQYMEFRNVAVDFIELRERLTSLGLTPRERQLLEEALAIIRVSAPLQEDIMQRILGGEEGAGVHTAIIDEDLPLEIELLSIFAELIREVQDGAYAARAASESRFHVALRVLAMVAALIIISIVLGAARVVTRLRDIETSLNEEKELALGTLDNIADGVIVTDASGTILSINRPAEQLTGTHAPAVQGRCIDEVYNPQHPAGDPSLPATEFARMLCGPASRPFRPQRLMGEGGTACHVQETVSPIFNPAGEAVRVSYIIRDVSADMARMAQMSWEASHDHLTGVLNRRAFELELRGALDSARDGPGHALIYLDLDDFKQLNDSFGHQAGDAFLIQLARTMNGCIRRHDRLARLGGDEFAVLLRDCSVDDAELIVQNLFAGVSGMEFVFEGQRIGGVGVSIGVMPITSGAMDAHGIMRKVDEACYHAKRTGKNRVCVAE